NEPAGGSDRGVRCRRHGRLGAIAPRTGADGPRRRDTGHLGAAGSRGSRCAPLPLPRSGLGPGGPDPARRSGQPHRHGVARRAANGAAIAAATTALTLAPGIASEHHFGTDPDAADGSSAQAVEQLWAEVPPTDPTPEAAAPSRSDPGAGSSGTGAPLPPL